MAMAATLRLRAGLIGDMEGVALSVVTPKGSFKAIAVAGGLSWNGSVVGLGTRHSGEPPRGNAECRALPLRPGRRQQDDRFEPAVDLDGEGDLALRVET
jgi:hypothetical protein